jgi:hypothetical protein
MQVFDQAPTLRHGQQQRVEREQEADERAQRREQPGRLVDRARRAPEQCRGEVGWTHVQTIAGQPLELGADGPLALWRRAHVDARQATRQPRKGLHRQKRRERDRTVAERAAVAAKQARNEERLLRARSKPQLDRPDRRCSDPLGDLARQREDTSAPAERGDAHVLGNAAAEASQSRIGPDQIDRLLPARPDDVRVLFEDRHSGLDAAQALHLAEQPGFEAVAVS